MSLARRDVLRGAVAVAAAVPASSCSAGAAPAQFTPEEFGAAGNGVTDDYDAFQRMAGAANQSGGGAIILRPGAQYFLDRFVSAANGVTDIIFEGCSGLEVQGNSASILVKGDIHRDSLTTRGLSGLRFEDCAQVRVQNLQVIGNVQLMTRSATITEAPTHGLLFGGCSDVIIDGVLVRHFATDGLYVRASMKPDAGGRYRASRRFEVRNSKFLFNARQGLSVIQLRDATFVDCEFSHTGYVAEPARSGPYGVHAPGAGVDVEPNATPSIGRAVDVLTGNVAFRGCRMIGNLGKSFAIAAYTGGDPVSENVSLDHCVLEADQVSTSRYGLIFDVPGGSIIDCTLTMGSKTAFVGWAAGSDASPVLRGNAITGSSGGSNRPFFFLRKTLGSPLIEQNRFLGDHRVPPASSAKAPQLIVFDNPNALVRDNEFFIPREACPPGARGLVAAVITNARSMTGNWFETDLPSAAGIPRSFGVIYGQATKAANELFRGTRPGVQDTVQPAQPGRGQAAHDSRLPWSS